MNFTCNLRYVSEWEWMLHEGMPNPEIARKVGLADSEILELVEGNTWYAPLAATGGELVHPELVYQGLYQPA